MSTDFNLDAAIERWRKNLSQSPEIRTASLDELEAHLRDSVATLRAGGLDEGESFLVASRRMGSGTDLCTEFAKVNRTGVWLNRALWMVIGIQLWAVLGGVCRMLTDLLVLAGLAGSGYKPGESPERVGDFASVASVIINLPSIAFTLVYLSALAAALWIGWRVARRKEQQLASLLRRPYVVGMAAIALCFATLASWVTQIARHALMVRWYGPDGFVQIASVEAAGSTWVFVSTTIGVAALMVWLFRRQQQFRNGPVAD